MDEAAAPSFESATRAAPPIARSPIRPPPPVAVVHGWEVSTRTSDAAFTLADHTPLAKVLVRADEGTDPDGVGLGHAARRPDGVLVIGSGPGEWLLLGPVGAAPALVADGQEARAGSFASVVDLTHGRALVRLTGEQSVALMAKVCAIDLADEVRPNGSAFRSSVAKLVTDVVRDDRPGGTRSYLLHCERSSGQHLFDSLLDAGAELGIDVAGFDPIT